MSAPVVVTAEMDEDGRLRVCASSTGERMRLTADEAAALVAVLLANGEVHSKWLHGGGR